MKLTRKLTIFTMFLATSGLAGASIYMGVRLSEQPDVVPEASRAQISDVFTCDFGFTDDFSLSNLNEERWNFPSRDYAEVDLSDDTLRITLTEPADSQTAFIHTQATYIQDFKAEVDILSIFIPPGSNNAAADLIFYDTNDELNPIKFRIRRTKEGTVAGTLTERLVASSGNFRREIDLAPTTGTLKFIMQREGDTITASYIVDNLPATLLTVENITGGGQFALYVLNLEENTAVVTAEFDNFSLDCPSGLTFPTNTPFPTQILPPTSTPIFTPTPTITPTPTEVPLPETAIISDKADRLILAVAFIILGVVLFRTSLKHHKAR